MQNNEKNDDKVQFVLRLYNSEAQRNIFQVVFQRLTFTPSISIYEMARVALKIELGQDGYDEKFNDINSDPDVALEEEIIKPYRRICQELKNHAINSKGIDSSKKAIASAKIYDQELQTRQFNIYNSIAQKAGFPKVGVKGVAIFEKTPSFDMIWSALDLEGTVCKKKILSRKGCRDCKNTMIAKRKK